MMPGWPRCRQPPHRPILQRRSARYVGRTHQKSRHVLWVCCSADGPARHTLGLPLHQTSVSWTSLLSTMDRGRLTWSARPGEWGGGEDYSTLSARGEKMQSIVGIALLVVGVVLIIFGMQASASLGSRLSELFTGAPSDRTIWLLVAGVAAAILGLGLLLVGRRRTL